MTNLLIAALITAMVAAVLSVTGHLMVMAGISFIIAGALLVLYTIFRREKNGDR